MRRAAKRARKGKGGSVMEFMPHSLHDHTTADAARRYRGEDEVKDAWTREPMLRLRKYLTAQKLWDEATEKAWIEECGRLVDIEINAYLELPVQPVEAMFDYLYGDPPPELLEQRAARSEEHTSELPSLMRISYAVFCLHKKKTNTT